MRKGALIFICAALIVTAVPAMAELENVRRRAERDKVDARKFAVSDFARDLLTIPDNLRRAIDAISTEGSEDGSDDGSDEAA